MRWAFCVAHRNLLQSCRWHVGVESGLCLLDVLANKPITGLRPQSGYVAVLQRDVAFSEWYVVLAWLILNSAPLPASPKSTPLFSAGWQWGRLEGATDGITLIEKFINRPATLIYLDPRYLGERTNGYNIDAKDKEYHQRLLQLVNQANCLMALWKLPW